MTDGFVTEWQRIAVILLVKGCCSTYPERSSCYINDEPPRSLRFHSPLVLRKTILLELHKDLCLKRKSIRDDVRPRLVAAGQLEMIWRRKDLDESPETKRI